MKKLKPFIKWAGGKGQFIDALLSSMPKDYNTYIEPFVGGGAMFFNISPKNFIINDINEELMITYNVLACRERERERERETS